VSGFLLLAVMRGQKSVAGGTSCVKYIGRIPYFNGIVMRRKLRGRGTIPARLQVRACYFSHKVFILCRLTLGLF